MIAAAQMVAHAPTVKIVADLWRPVGRNKAL